MGIRPSEFHDSPTPLRAPVIHRVRVEGLIFELSTLQRDPDKVDRMVQGLLDHLPEWSASTVSIAYFVEPDPRRQRGSLA